MAFLLMGLGMKLTSASTTNINKESKPDLMFPDGSVEDHNHLTEARKTEAKSIKSLDQGNGSLHNPKRYIRRSNSEMTFGSDSFVPCVVLISNQNVNCHKPITNIGTSFRGSRTRRRASLDVINENNNINKATKWSEVVHRRRTSLPAVLASCKKKTVMSSVLVDTSTLAEVHAAVEELSKQPSNLVDFVNKLQDLLSPYKLDQVKPRQVVWLQKHNDGSDDETICLSPTRISSKRLQRRQEWQNGHRDLFSTTTTATGLPKEEPILPKPRRLPKIWKDKTPVGTPLDSRCGSPGSEGVIPYNIGRRRTYPNIPVSHAHNIFSTSPNTAITNAVSAISSDYESDDPIAPTTVRSKSVAEDEERRSHPHHHFVLDGRLTPPILPSEEVYHRSGAVTPPLEKHKILEEDIVADGRHNNQFSCDQIDEGHSLFQSYQEQLLDSVYNWNFQIFQLAEDTNCVLSQMAFKLFQDTGLFDTFNIPKREFVCYMKALESGYRRIPYHNRIHAADVLHGCWFLSTQEIPGFHDHSPLFSSDSSDSDSGTSTTNARQVNNIGNGSLAQAIPALELMSLYLAAAMHDYDHPGRTNAFLVETRHPLAILYNDRSVLENHHASASWDLLYSDENFDFLKNLDTAEWKRLRFLIVEAILATDLKKHRDILAQFQAKSQQPLSRCTSTDETGVDTPARTGFNWSADEDRLLVCKMVIKLADIGGPAKSKRLHITWTKAICEEFFIQGDEERRLGVPVSPFMDRERPQVAELQRTFITNLIKPIVTSMHKTGILAGVIPGDDDPDVDEGPNSENNLLLEQLKSNLSYWMISTSLSGHEEMAEAFKFALTYRLSSSSGTDAVATPAKSKEIDSTSHRTPTSNPTDDGAQARPDDDEVFDEDIDSCGEKRDLKFNNTLPSVQTTRNSSNSKFFQTNESGNINVSRRHSSATLPSRTSHAGSD